MVNYVSAKSQALSGNIQVPGDKSISHRAIMLSAIAEGDTQIHGFLMGADNLATVAAFRSMGVPISIEKPEHLIVHGVGRHGLQPPKHILDLGNSGTAIRLLAGLLAGQRFDSELTGDASLKRRPMQRIITPLQLMGAHIDATANGLPPLYIHGGSHLQGIEYVLPVASAQVKSCLLLAGLYAAGQTVLIESVSTRDHTERLLNWFGYPIDIKPGHVAIIGGKPLIARDVVIPADISSAAFFMVAAAITPGSNMTLEAVGINPTRTGIIELLKMMGANIELKHHREQSGEPVADIVVTYTPLTGIEVPKELVAAAIDEFPVFLIAAASAKGQTVLHGAAELRVKETDRIAAMVTGLNRMGIVAEALPDGVVLTGGRFTGGNIDSFGDHRIAMAFAIAGSVSISPIKISDCDNVATSFPNFVQIANSIGMHIETQG